MHDWTYGQQDQPSCIDAASLPGHKLAKKTRKRRLRFITTCFRVGDFRRLWLAAFCNVWSIGNWGWCNIFHLFLFVLQKEMKHTIVFQWTSLYDDKTKKQPLIISCGIVMTYLNNDHGGSHTRLILTYTAPCHAHRIGQRILLMQPDGRIKPIAVHDPSFLSTLHISIVYRQWWADSSLSPASATDALDNVSLHI